MTGPALALAAGLLTFALLLRRTEPDAEVRSYWSFRLLLSVFMGLALWRLTPFWTRWDVVYYDPILLLSVNPGLPGLFGGLFAFLGTGAFSIWQARKMRPGTRRRPLVGPTLAALAVLTAGLAAEVLLTPPPPPVAALALETLVPDLEGRSHALSDWKGKTVLLHFWSTASPAVRAEVPEYRLYQKTARTGVAVVGVNASAAEAAGLSSVLRFVSEQKMGWTQLTDPDGALQKAFGVTSLPTTVVLGPGGQVLDRREGAVDQSWLQQAGRAFGL